MGGQYRDEETEFTGSAGRDRGYPTGTERMVPIVRSSVHHADGSDMWGHIISEGGNVREKQRKVAKEVY